GSKAISRSPQSADAGKHGAGRGISCGDGFLADSGEQGSCHFLAQLDAPLIEGIDAVQYRFYENAVFVEGNQPSEGEGVELAVEQGQRWAVARECLVRRKRAGDIRRNAAFQHSLFGFLLRASLAERLRLRKAIGKEQAVMVIEVRFVRGRGDQKFHRN